MAGGRKAAVEMCHQMQLSMAEREGRQRVWELLRVDGGARLPVRAKMPGTSSVLQYFLFHCLHVGKELQATIPVVHSTLTDMARSRVAANPPTISFWSWYSSHRKKYHPLVGPEGKVLWRRISWRKGDQEQMGSVRVRSHVEAGTPRRVRLPVLFGMLLTREITIPSWGREGEVLWLCLCLSYFLVARSDDLFAPDSGAAHSVHCLTRGDVAIYADGTQLQYMRW